MNREIIELREVITKLVPLIAGKGLKVTQRGTQAYVRANPSTLKPELVNIPNVPDNATPDFIRAIQGFIDHEIGHVLITDWEYYGGHPAPTQRELAKASVRRFMNLHNIVEDTMIEPEMMKLFPGSRKNIGDLRRHFIAKVTKPAVDAAKSEKEAFGYLMVAAMRALAGHTEFQEFMDQGGHWDNQYVKELVDKLSDETKKRLPKLTSTKETLEVARELDAILYPPPPVLSSVSPDTGFTTGGDEIVIEGSNLVNIRSIRIGGTPVRTFEVVDPKHAAKTGNMGAALGSGAPCILAITPKGSAGPADVEVTTITGTGKLTGAFTYVQAPALPQTQPQQSQDPDQDEDGESQDKPDQKAGEGDGDGERDHQESDDDDAGDTSDGKGGAGADEDEEDNSAGDEEEDDNSADGQDESESDDGADGQDDDTSDSEDAGAGSDGDEEDENADDEDEASSAGGRSDEESEDDDAEDSGRGEDDKDSEDDDGSSADEEDDGDNDKGQDETSGGSGSDDEEGEDADGSGQTDEAGSQLAGEQGANQGDYSEDDDGGGVGSGMGKSVFDFEDGDFEGKDLASGIAQILTREAIQVNKSSEYNVYTREFDRIETAPSPEINSSWVPALEDKTRQMTGRMQKDIERMMASQSHVVRIPGYRSGRLHGPNLHRLLANDNRVFNRRQEHTSKDTAVTLLVDNSGSMGTGGKIETAMIAAYALSQTLERVNIANEVIGFTTGNYHGMPSTVMQAMQDEIRNSGVKYHRTTPIVMPIYKSFDERINAEIKRRFAYMLNAQQGMVANVDGESLEYAASRLFRRMEKRKVILVLSDGWPAGAQNAGDHLAATVEKVSKLGIDCIGIGIMDEAVKHYYPRYTVLQDVDELPGKVMGELKQLLA